MYQKMTPSWAKTGFKDLKNLSERVESHQKSENHINYSSKYAYLEPPISLMN